MVTTEKKSLRHAELFESLTDADLGELELEVRWMEVRQGRFLFLSEDAPSSVLLVREGRIKLFRLSGKGKELILDIVGPGDLFGERSVLDCEPLESAAEALEDSLVATFPAAVLKRWFERRPEILFKLSHLMAVRSKRLEERLADFAFKSLSARLATLLLQLSRDHGVHDRRGILLPLRLSQAAMGSFIGGSREMVNLTLAKMRRAGVIDVDGSRLLIRQRDALERLNA